MVSFGLLYLINIYRNTWFAVLMLLTFTCFMGLFASLTIGAILGAQNGAIVVSQATGGTAIIILLCSTLGVTTKKNLKSWGKPLFIILLALLGLVLMNVFLQISIPSTIISAISLMLFSVYLIYDVNKVVSGEETNYIVATMTVYLDMVNIFLSLLGLLKEG